MPLTRKNVEQLIALDIRMKSKHLTYTHGFSAGLDMAVIGGPVGMEHDYSLYHAAVMDAELSKGSRFIVAQLNSHVTEHIETFINKWLDKDFKFT
jgi:hypothetical protein